MEEIKITHDDIIQIATGAGRKEISWKNTEIHWSQFLNKLKSTIRTNETLAEYTKLSKTRQDEIKDVGGFVGGYVANGRRKKGNVLTRSLITLDIDFASHDLWELFQMNFTNAAALYSTHKQTPEKPRLR